MSPGDDAEVRAYTTLVPTFLPALLYLVCCRQGSTPSYEMLSSRGYDHSRLFTMQVMTQTLVSVSAHLCTGDMNTRRS